MTDAPSPRRSLLAWGRALRALLAALCAGGGACTPAAPGLEAFQGGFDPVRYDAGPLPALDAQANDGRPLRFAIPPFYADALAEGGVRDLDAWLEREVGIDVAITAPAAYSYAEVADALVRGDVDVAELSPYQYALLLVRQTNVIPLAASVAHGASTYGSYIVVRQGDPSLQPGATRGVEALRGKRVAFVDPLSTSGWLLPSAFLEGRGLDLEKDLTVIFAGSHPAALEAVMNGDVDAACVSSDLLIGKAGLAGPLVVVAKAGRMPYDAIVARPGLAPDVVARVQSALLRLSIHSQEGRAALRAFSTVDGFMPVPPGHYDGVVALARAASSAPPAADRAAP